MKHRKVSVEGEWDLLGTLPGLVYDFGELCIFEESNQSTVMVSSFNDGNSCFNAGTAGRRKSECVAPGAVCLHRCHRWQRIRAKSQILAISSES